MASIESVQLPILQEKKAPKIARSRMSRWRFLVLGIVQVLIILHVVQWYVTGSTFTPVEPSEAMKTVQEGVITVGAIFFAAAILSTLVFGRFFCGWGCHVILLQDFCGSLLKKVGVRPKPFRSRLLLWLPLCLALYMFVWPIVHRFAIAPWMNVDASWPGFSWELTTTNFWSTFPGIAMAIPFLLVCGFLTVYVLGMKGYCTYGCPYGGIFAPAEQVSPVRIRVTDDCEHCGHCTAACTSNVRVHEEVWTHGMVVDPGCMKCMDCVSVCPNDALYVGLGKTAIGIKSNKEKPTQKRKYDLSWTEEVIFAVIAVLILVSIRGAYSLPLLFASGVAAIGTWVIWKAWRIIRDPNASFHRRRLKFHGRYHLSGVLFVMIAVVLCLGLIQTGAVNFMAMKAHRFDDRVNLPAQVVFTINGMAPQFGMAEDARKAIAYYDRAGFIGDGGWSLIPSHRTEFSLRKAWLLAVLQRYDEAIEEFDGIIDRNGLDEDLAMGRGQLELVSNQQNIDNWYDEILREHPTWSRLREDRIRLRLEGLDYGGALSEARIGYEASPNNLLSMRRLAVLLLDFGQYPDWIKSGEITERTLEIDPDNPAAWRALALVKAKLGDFQAAQIAMEKAVELAPRNYQIRSNFVRLLNDMGMRKRALAEHAESLRLWQEQGELGEPPQMPEQRVGPRAP